MCVLDLRRARARVVPDARDRVSLHVVTLLPRGRRTRRRACPSINVNQPLNNDAPCKEDFIVLRREQSWRHNAAPSFFSAAELPPKRWDLRESAPFFLLPFFSLSLLFLHEALLHCMWRMCFSVCYSGVDYPRNCTHATALPSKRKRSRGVTGVGINL